MIPWHRFTSRGDIFKPGDYRIEIILQLGAYPKVIG